MVAFLGGPFPGEKGVSLNWPYLLFAESVVSEKGTVQADPSLWPNGAIVRGNRAGVGRIQGPGRREAAMRATVGMMLAGAALLGTARLPLSAQSVISARAGLVNYTEGPVLLNGTQSQPARGVFPQMGKQDTLRTTRGRAEVLLNPGAFLRVDRDSSIRLLSNEITDSRVELAAGTLVLEAAEVRKDTSVGLQYRNATISIRKRGVYRLDSDPAALRVFDGKAVVESGGQRIEVGKGRMVSLDDTLATTKFNPKNPDSLDLWSRTRAGFLASVNLSTARSMSGRNSVFSCYGWCWNSLYGMVTYMPLQGMYLSPYGYYFVSRQEFTRYQSASTQGGGQTSAGWRGDASSVYPGSGSMSGSAGSATRVAPPASVSAPPSSSSRPAPPAMARPGTR